VIRERVSKRLLFKKGEKLFKTRGEEQRMDFVEEKIA